MYNSLNSVGVDCQILDICELWRAKSRDGNTEIVVESSSECLDLAVKSA